MRILALDWCDGTAFAPLARRSFALHASLAEEIALDNAYVATGHSVWGILNAPATGETMAELILDGTARIVDLSPFDPARLPCSTPRACA